MFTENPFYKLLTNHSIYAPLASSPVISVIVAIDSDGTISQQDDVTESLVLARPNDEDLIGQFEQDSTDFQLYHYVFSPLQRRNMGQYIIYSGTYQNYVRSICHVCTHMYLPSCCILFRNK